MMLMMLMLMNVFVFVAQIDDKEFDIPQVDTPPTLESILNEVRHFSHKHRTVFDSAAGNNPV